VDITEQDLAVRLSALPHRSIVAIVGAPGAGKSTLAESLVASQGGAALLPMDGFHLDDAVLRDLGRQERKGAPDTFDAAGLWSTLKRIRAGEDTVAVPVFDRASEISHAAARLIPARARLVLVEGNYLLLDRTPWQSLASLFDLTVMIDVPEAELRRRLTLRWQEHGLSEAEIARKLDRNDIPNGRTVSEESRDADLVLRPASAA
tara:strand:+ start:23854 stop:24468 length:615 start_codon:yes stop_codon:yes gene_type:complete